MPTGQWLIDGFLVANFLVYIVAAKALFRTDSAEAPAYLFMASFLSLCATTLYFLWAFPINVLENWLIAGCLGIASQLLFRWSADAIRAQPFTVIFSPDLPTYLNTLGPYQHIRHPFYVAYMFNFAAVAIVSSSWIPTGILFIIYLIYFFGARSEENKFARSPMSNHYAAYKRRTGMFIPRFGRKGAQG
jgi:protein-S-isoprenylcysteine O-methyltransferase Ste14